MVSVPLHIFPQHPGGEEVLLENAGEFVVNMNVPLYTRVYLLYVDAKSTGV